MTVRTALQQGQQLLEDSGVPESHLTAEVLLMQAISLSQPCDRSWLYAHSTDELRELWWIHYGRYLHERMQGKPTQYITGHQEFYGRDFRVTRDVLIPRPETEHLVEAALARANAAEAAPAQIAESSHRTANVNERADDDSRKDYGAANVNERAFENKRRPDSRILDIGAGSGAIGITLALETKSHVFATDISTPALGVASENARKLGATVNFLACDLGSAFADESFDMIVSNPPYVPSRDRDKVQREVRDFEPEIALYGGEDGLDVYRRLIPEAHRLLKPGGWLIMELGFEIADLVREMLADWKNVELIDDLAGIPRVVQARKP